MQEPSWTTIISFIVCYVLGVVTSVVYHDEILQFVIGLIER